MNSSGVLGDRSQPGEFLLQVGHTSEFDAAALGKERELVHPLWQRRGLGAAMMHALERVITVAYDIGALGVNDETTPFYEHRNWIKWLGPTSAMTLDGVVRTPDEDDCIYVLPLRNPRNEVSLEVTGELTCDWRDGDVW